MYYAYLPSKLDKKIHSGAVNQVVAAPILCLFWLLFFSTVRSGFSAATSMFTFVVLIITIIICLSHVCFGHFKYLSAHNYKIDTQEVDGSDERPTSAAATTKAAQMYIAQVLQDPNSEENGSGEDDGQGSSQDEEIINVENGLNEDFQSGEDSLIDNEVRHWYYLEQKFNMRSALNIWIQLRTETTVLQSISTSIEGFYTNVSTLSTKD